MRTINPQYPKNGKPHIIEHTGESDQEHVAEDLLPESCSEPLLHHLPQLVSEQCIRVLERTIKWLAELYQMKQKD